MGNKVSVNGMEFNSVKDAAKHYNINYMTLMKRLSRHRDLSIAINKPVMRKKKQIEIAEVLYESLTEVSRQYNINFDTLRMRLKRGKTIEEAVSKVK